MKQNQPPQQSSQLHPNKNNTKNNDNNRIKSASPERSAILEAARDGNIEFLEQISDDDLQSAVCSAGCTALHWAAGGIPSHEATTNHNIVDSDNALKDKNNYNDSSSSSTSSSIVAMLEYLVTQRQLFANRLDVPVQRNRPARGRTPLHYAARNGNLEAVRWLVTKQFENSMQQQLQHLLENQNSNETPDNNNVSIRPSLADIANPTLARHKVTPFQLAVWRNQSAVVRWLVERAGVDPAQVNDFACGALHWIGLAPVECSTIVHKNTRNNADDYDDDDEPLLETGEALIPLADWLTRQPGVMQVHQDNNNDTTPRHSFPVQAQGHSVLHKAAWGGHLHLCQYWHNVHGQWDNQRDQAGNYAADLADMAHTPRHNLVAQYLRQVCSPEKSQSCALLGITMPTQIQPVQLQSSSNHAVTGNGDTNNHHNDATDNSNGERGTNNNNNGENNKNDTNETMRTEDHANNKLLQQAYWKAARAMHPDGPQQRRRRRQQEGENDDTDNNNNNNNNKEPSFDQIHQAYRHLRDTGGMGTQSNPAHSLPLLLQMHRLDDDDDDNDSDANDKDDAVDPYFAIRLWAVVHEFGTDGMDISNLAKKWHQVWPDVPLGYEKENGSGKKKISLTDWLLQHPGRGVVEKQKTTDTDEDVNHSGTRSARVVLWRIPGGGGVRLVAQAPQH